MEIIKHFIDLFVHLDAHMADLIAQYGSFVYTIVFCIIFAETGFVITPFSPGDSLLFVLGAFAAQGALKLELLIPSLCPNRSCRWVTCRSSKSSCSS
jgi:membrane-associated protein